MHSVLESLKAFPKVLLKALLKACPKALLKA
jgi:hypothetical protein